MKRSFVPAGIFVLVLVLAAVTMKIYVKYEYQSAMEQLDRVEAVFSVREDKTENWYGLSDPEIQVALAGFLQDALALDKSVNGDPKPMPSEGGSYGVNGAGGVTLLVSAADPTICYIRGRIFTHYLTGGEAVVTYLSQLTESLAAKL